MIARHVQKGRCFMESDKNFDDGRGLIPVSIIAFGPSTAPVERLMGLQSAVAKAIGWIVDLRLPRLRLPRAFALHLLPTRQGDL